MKTLQWLVRREFWENKGGFFWAPVISGAVFLVINMLGLAVASAAAGRSHIQIGMIKLDALLKSVDPKAMAMAAAGIDMTILLVASLISAVTAIVVFFYCLGAFYDERRDRSILFWKSLPLSDRDTMLSKAFSALVLAPGIGLLAGIVTAFGVLILVSIFAAFHGQNLLGLLFWESHPLRVTLLAILSLPIAALWSLPTVGWLCLCSAWARSKPFLWALAIPVGSGMLVSWFDLMERLTQPDIWYWKHVVARLLFSVVPGAWMNEADWELLGHIKSPADVEQLMSIGQMYSVMGSANIWIGAAAGIAMLVAATRLRRWRDEA